MLEMCDFKSLTNLNFKLRTYCQLLWLSRAYLPLLWLSHLTLHDDPPKLAFPVFYHLREKNRKRSQNT